MPIKGMSISLPVFSGGCDLAFSVADFHGSDLHRDHILFEADFDAVYDQHAINIKTSNFTRHPCNPTTNTKLLRCYYLITLYRMLAKMRILNFWFSRSRLRRGPIFEESLKDLTRNQDIQNQMKVAREEFERSDLTETFSEVLKEEKPRLKRRFKVDTVKLNKDLKEKIKLQIQPQKFIPASQEKDDLKFLNEGKSYLNDQSAMVQFEQKFQRELFMKKETNRLLKKQENNHRNYLPGAEENRFNKYEAAKKQLKNNRINSMMNYKRNNQELQLLIQSGLMEQPDNLKMLIQHMGQSQTNEQKPQQAQIGHEGEQPEGNYLENILTQQMQKQKMISNVDGPEQLRDYDKVESFIHKFESSTVQDRKKAEEDVNLLLKVREYERQLFLSRYDQINFRFKGRVDFDHFKEPELLSYIKTEEIDPKELLMIFEQSKDSLNRFNLPIITPAVMSRIYSKTSTYQFSQTDENNHINMLNDPTFIKLERTLFRELDKINDELFCDTVWTYAKNHELEEGRLNLNMSDAIQRAIFAEIGERINRLKEADLGLLMRSIIKLNLLSHKDYTLKWGEIIESLEQRLPLMKQSYEYESVLEFVCLVPENQRSINLLANNLGYFKKYEWGAKDTLLSFFRVSSALIANNYLIDPLEHNKAFLILKETVANKSEQIKAIIPTLTINEIPKMIAVFQQLNKHAVGPSVPPILVNTAKKEIVNCIHTQKTKIYQYTLPSLVNTLAAYDYHSSILKKQSKYIDKDELILHSQNTNIMKTVLLRHLIPGRVHAFNSKLYFVYHQLARLVEKEIPYLSGQSIADSIYGLSLAQYKNEGLYDSLAYKLLEKIEKQHGQRGVKRYSLKQTADLMKIVASYSLQKRTTNLVEQIYDGILEKGAQNFKSIQLNILIKFFGTYANLFTFQTEEPKPENPHYQAQMMKWKRNKSSMLVFLYCYQNYISSIKKKLEKQELIVCYLINSLFLNNASRILENRVSESLQFEQALKKLKKNSIELVEQIKQISSEKIKPEYRYVIALCHKLNTFDIQAILQQTPAFNLEANQALFYNKFIDSILDHEQNIGTSTSYKNSYAKIAKHIRGLPANSSSQIKEKMWRIEVEDKKVVYFLATYEHLMSKIDEEGTSFGLFGIWKIYSQLYRRQGWKFELIFTMLQE